MVPKSSESGIDVKNPAVHPASLLPSAPAKNHTPIIIPTIFTGASFVNTDRPTGETES